MASDDTTTAWIDIYLEVDCTSSYGLADCSTFSASLIGGPDFTTLASYMQATSGILSGGATSVVMVRQTTPPSVLTSWQSVLEDALPSDFAESDAASLATSLAEAYLTPEWILQMPSDVQKYFVSAILPSYATPMTYYEYLSYRVDPTPPPVQSSNSSATSLQGINSTLTSIATVVWTSYAIETFSRSWLDAPFSTTISQTASPSTSLSVSKNLGSARTAAVAVPIALVALLLICWFMIYHKRIRPARERGNDEIEEPPTYHDGPQKEDIYSSEPAVSSAEKNVESATQELPAIAIDPTTASELEGTDAAVVRTSNTKPQVTKEHGSCSIAGQNTAGSKTHGGVDAPSSTAYRYG